MNTPHIYFIAGVAVGSILMLIILLNRFKQAKVAKEDVPQVLEVPKPAVISELEKQILQNEEISFIFKLIEKISLKLNKHEIAVHLVGEVNKFMDTGNCVLFLLDEDAEQIRVQHALGVKKDELEQFVFKKGESVSGWVFQGNEPALVNNLNSNSWLKQINKEEYLKDAAFISVPLSIENKVLGVMNVCNKRTEDAFTKEDLGLLINVAKIAAIAFEGVRLHEKMEHEYLRTITVLAETIDAKDSYTKKHSQKVTRYALSIAKHMRCRLSEIEAIRRAAMLHDIGKIGIKDAVLLKPDKLTPEEFEQIKLHPQKGEEIVKPLAFLSQVGSLIRHHHERFDGKGYPDGIDGKQISLGARILAVADAFDAMNSDRTYRKRLGLEEAKQELREHRGVRFDPEVVDCFLEILEQNPQIIERW